MKPHKRTPVILLNPSSGQGRALKSLPKLEQELEKQGLSLEIIVTHSEIHLRELTRNYSQAQIPLIAAGGDSTLAILIEETLKTNPKNIIGFIGLGSSDDIAREFDTETIKKSVSAIKSGGVSQIDLGKLTLAGDFGKKMTYFPGQVNIGLGAFVNNYVAQMVKEKKWYRKVQFLVGLSAIRKTYKNNNLPIACEIYNDGGLIFTGPINVILISNIRYWATGKLFSPYAKTSDGLLDMLIIKKQTFLETLKTAKKAENGRHLTSNDCISIQSNNFTIKTSTPTLVQADGEIINTKNNTLFNEFKISCETKKLNFLTTLSK